MSRIKSSPASSFPEIENIALGCAVVPSPDKEKNPYKVGTYLPRTSGPFSGS